MNGRILFALVAALFGVAHATFKSTDFSDADRWEATQQGVAHARATIESYKEAKARAASNPADMSSALLAKFFRRASPRTEAIGHARVFIEEAVKQTERRLFEKKRANIASVASKEERAEVLAAELYHKPGSLLTKKEYGHIYEESECEELREEVDCSMVENLNSVRTPDGTCNNLAEPTQGASFTPFGRLLPPRYEDGLFMPNGLRQSQFRDNHFKNGTFTPPYPSPRLVSTTLIRDRPDEDSTLTHLIMQIGQFLDHDLDLAVEFGGAEEICENFRECEITEICAPIQVPENDENFGVGEPRDGDCLPFARTIPACPNDPFEFVPREQVNELTHYIDGSMIYGSTAEEAEFLRDEEDGLLKVSPPLPGENMDNLPERNATAEAPCPRGRSSCFFAGDLRVNEQVSLSVMHTVWVREHNRVARALKAVNTDFDDERLYQDARRIVIAQWQQIVYEEYLPIILGPDHEELLGPYLGYQPDVEVFVPNVFATAAYRFGHSQIQPMFDRLDARNNPIPRGPLNLVDAFMNPQEYFDGGGTSPIARGWISQNARALDEFLNSVLTTQLFELTPGMGMDLATLNLQRGRDHGLPPYLVWKNYCEERFNISSEFTNELTKIRLLQTYGSLDTVDVFIGALAEEPLPGAVVGATLACIFSITFSRLRDGDRFFYKNPDLNVLNSDQLATIGRTSLARVLCDNTGISVIQRNPFRPGSALPCSPLFVPGINFDEFRVDQFCYISIAGTAPLRPDLSISLVNSQANDEMFQFFTVDDLPLEPTCFPFRCPRNTITTIVAFPTLVGGDTTNFLECTVAVTHGLPNQDTSAPSIYQRSLSQNDIVAANGLYESLTSCEAANAATITYTCPSSRSQAASDGNANDVTTEDLEHELARILNSDKVSSDGNMQQQKKQKASTQSIVGHPIINLTYRGCIREMEIPNSICEAENNRRNGPGTAMVSEEKASHEDSDKGQEKTEELINLLEATLQELKHN